MLEEENPSFLSLKERKRESQANMYALGALLFILQRNNRAHSIKSAAQTEATADASLTPAWGRTSSATGAKNTSPPKKIMPS